MLAVASQPAISLPTVDDPVAVGLGTFNNDVYQDAVVLGSGGNLTLATGGNDDNWQTISSADPGIGAQQTLLAERLTADSFTDLVTQSADEVNVLHSDGAGGFSVAQTLAAPSAGGFASSSSNTLAVDLVDTDPIRDLVAVAGADSAVLVYRGNDGGTFESPTSYSTGVAAPTTVAVADVIGDDLPDLVVGHQDGSIVFFEGVAIANETTLQRRDDLTLTEAAAIQDLSSADFDGDGNADLVVTTSSDAFVLFSADDPMTNPPVVNGTFSAGLTGWETEIVGHVSGDTPGRVSALGGAAQFTENESFLTSLKQTVVIPSDVQSLSFDLLALGLDDVAGGIPDAFEVSLLDDNQQSLVATHQANSTAFFNVSSGSVASVAAGVSLSGSTVTLDVSSLAAGSVATLVFDLIGNPPGDSSVVTIDNVTITPEVILSSDLNRISLAGPFGSLVDTGLGDVDGDGNFDIVVVDQATDTLLVYNGDGARGFTRDPISLVAGSTANSIATGPLTANDSADDIIVTMRGSDLALSPLGADVTSPVVTLVDPVANSSQPTFGGDITISFSEPVRESGLGSVNNTAAHSVVGSGPDGVFGNGDDVSIAITGVSYDPATQTAVLTVDPVALPLADDDYQVVLDGTDTNNAIRDLVGNAVGGGADVVFDFRIDAALTIVPVADLSAGEGQSVSISTSFADPGLVGNYSAVIDWGDGTSDNASIALDGTGFAGTLSGDHVYADNGSYNLTVVLSDGDGEEATSSSIALIANSAPTLGGLNDVSATENTLMTFTNLFSISDPGFTFGSSVEEFTATIDWGDGSAVTTITDIDEQLGGPNSPTTADVSAEHTYTSEGIYTVTITVTDDDGDSVTGVLQAFVSNTAPVLAPISDTSADEGGLVTVAGTYSDDDLGPGIDPDTIHTLVIDWGDGAQDAVTPVAALGTEASYSASHVYADDGDYEIRVTVTDSDSGQATQTATASIAGVAPTATAASDATAIAGQSMTFALASFTDPGFTSTTAGTDENL